MRRLLKAKNLLENNYGALATFLMSTKKIKMKVT